MTAAVLRNLKIGAVALVDKGAGRGVRVTLFKRREPASEETPLKKMLTLEEVLAKLPEEDQAPILAALEAAKASEKMDEEHEEKADDEEAEKADEPEEKADDEEAEKADDEEEDEDKKASKRLSKALSINKALEAEVAKLRDAEERREFIAKAESFEIPGLGTDDLGAILRSVAKGRAVTKDLAKKWEAALASVTEFVRKSNLIEESGRVGAGTAGDAWAQIQKRGEVISKEQGVSLHHGIAAVMKSNPELYAEYEAERRAELQGGN